MDQQHDDQSTAGGIHPKGRVERLSPAVDSGKGINGWPITVYWNRAPGGGGSCGVS